MSSVQSIYINKTEMYMQVNTYDVLHVHTLPVDAENDEIGWEIKDTSVVSLNNNIGQLRALRVGDTDVTVYVKSNPSIRATCKVHVRGRIPVESISFLVTDYTLNSNNTMKLGVRILPTNATNQNVTWISCCPEIATVDSDGTVRPQTPGKVDIYATAEDGNLTAKCTITINEYIPVRSIRFANSELTLKQSNTKKLNAIIEPSNATYPQVIWHSCCPDVATVDSSGKITPHSTGYADIYATTVDGNFTAYCTVRVVIEDVTIKNVDYFTEVHFESGKIWKCINKDMIYNTENISTLIVGRATYNILATDENGVLNGEYKTYSNEELRFLYAIDPYGVAAYIARYADDVIRKNYEGDEALKKMVEYKDVKFEMLFNRKPKYFKRVANATIEWVETTDLSDIHAVISESESLFGLRKVNDSISKYITSKSWDESLRSLVFAALGMMPYISDILTGVNMIVNTFVIISTTDQEYALQKLTCSYLKESADLETSKKYKYNILGWVEAILTTANALDDIVECSIVEKDFCKELTYYYSNCPYNTILNFSSGNQFTMNQIYDKLKMIVD